jgi:hypothetical protein
MEHDTLLSGSAATDPTPVATQHSPAAAYAVSTAAGLAEASERQTPTQSPFVAELQAQDAAGAQPDVLRAAKRRAVLRQVRAQREALTLLSRNAPVPAQLLRDVGPPTADFDPEVAHSGACWAHQIGVGMTPPAKQACCTGIAMLTSQFLGLPGRSLTRMRHMSRTMQHPVSTLQWRVRIASTARRSMAPAPR